MRRTFAVCVLIVCATWPSAAQDSVVESSRQKGFDVLLDTYVRDGQVYYRAMKSDRARLDSYVAALADASIESTSRETQLAFWLNAYNALVLKTVVDHYPIPRRSQDYPAGSIRQVPGAFERTAHRVAHRMVTLDEIEQNVLPGFSEPRAYLALGRGAMGSGRLRSEMYTASALESQLGEIAADCVSYATCLDIDRANNQVAISSVFSWRAQAFITAYAMSAREVFARRSPIERAVLAFVEPRLLTTEKDFLAKNEFRVAFKPFNWELNDLTGRGGR